jgi:hypothetical protein
MTRRGRCRAVVRLPGRHPSFLLARENCLRLPSSWGLTWNSQSSTPYRPSVPGRRPRPRYTIVIVTDNMQQATRVSDQTAFFSVLTDSKTDTAPGCSSSTARPGRSSRTPAIPAQAYVTGRIG